MAEPFKQLPLNELFSTAVALSDAGATSDHAAWLRKPGNPEKVVAFMNELRNRTFTARVTYVQPTFEELKHRFPLYVSPDYKERRGFSPIERYKAVSRESRVLAFEFVIMDLIVPTDAVLAEMDRRSLRPALYEELLGFVETYPYDQGCASSMVLAEMERRGSEPAYYTRVLDYAVRVPKRYRRKSIVALGSMTQRHGCDQVAYVRCDSAGQTLDMKVYVDMWDSGLFLAVHDAA